MLLALASALAAAAQPMATAPAPIIGVHLHAGKRRLVEAGFAKRIMFGSDQMAWPETIAVSIQAIESADFLTLEQKRAILYNNVVRFFRLAKLR